MKILDRYILRELAVPFLIGTMAVLLMFQANIVIFILKSSSPQAIPFTAILQIVMYETPSFLNMTLPVGTALAASLAISRLTRETELTAMRVAGAPILRVLAPIAVFGALVAVADFLVVEKVVPPSKKRSRELMAQSALIGQIPEFKSNVTFNLGNYTGNFGTISRNKEATRMEFTEAVLFERPRAKETLIYSAKSGEYRAGLFILRDVLIWQVKGNLLRSYSTKKEVPINERVAIPDIFSAPFTEEQTAEELRQSIIEGRRIGRNMTSQEVAYQTRFSLPAACLIFALVAPLFAVQFARTGAFMGVLLSLVLVIGYYNVYIVSTEILGRTGLVAPWVAAWLPNILFIALGIVGVRRLE